MSYTLLGISPQSYSTLLAASNFLRPNNHVYLDPITNSPVLQRTKKTENSFTALGKRITVEEWVKLRQTQQQRRGRVQVQITEDGKYTYDKKDLEILPGLAAKIYN